MAGLRRGSARRSGRSIRSGALVAVVALLTGLSPTAAFARPVHVTGRKSVSPIPAPTVRPAPGRTLDPSTEGH